MKTEPLRPNHQNKEEAVGLIEACAGLNTSIVVDGESATDDVEDVIVPKVAARPYQPTKAEIEAHEVTHLPYRNWCAHCVAGKGVSSPHRHGDEAEKIGITVSLDYCFMGDEAVEGMPAILILWDDGHRALWSLPVESKGATNQAVTWIVKKLEEAGYSGIGLTLKSHQEPLVMALKKAVALRRQAQTTPMESPVRESQSNGAIERAVRTWEGQFRTIRHQFEANIGAKINMDHPIIGWMVIWAGDLITRYVLRENGRTAFESMMGHRCKQLVCMFGETAMFRLAPDKSDRRKAESDWGIGMFVGIENRSSEYLFMNETGLYKCRTMKRMPRNKAFRAECLLEATATIEGYIDKGARTSVQSRQGEMAKEGMPGGRTFAPRRARLAPEDFKTHGFTVDCKGCIYLQDGIGHRCAHSSECRDRMEGKLQESEEGKDRVAKAQGRQDHWMASEIEKNDDKPDEKVGDKEDADKSAESLEEIELEDLDNNNSEILSDQNTSKPTGTGGGCEPGPSAKGASRSSPQNQNISDWEPMEDSDIEKLWENLDSDIDVADAPDTEPPDSPVRTRLVDRQAGQSRNSERLRNLARGGPTGQRARGVASTASPPEAAMTDEERFWVYGELPTSPIASEMETGAPNAAMAPNAVDTSMNSNGTSPQDVTVESNTVTYASDTSTDSNMMMMDNM